MVIFIDFYLNVRILECSNVWTFRKLRLLFSYSMNEQCNNLSYNSKDTNTNPTKV